MRVPKCGKRLFQTLSVVKTNIHFRSRTEDFLDFTGTRIQQIEQIFTDFLLKFVILKKKSVKICSIRLIRVPIKSKSRNCYKFFEGQKIGKSFFKRLKTRSIGMKKAVIAFVFSVIMVAANAQTFSLGGRVGYNWNNVNVPNFNGTVNFKTISNTNFGLVGDIAFTNNFSIQPELNYTQKGFRLQQTGNVTIFNTPLPVGVEAVTAVKYVEMPVLAKYRFGTEGVRFYVAAGPSVGYAVSGNLETYATAIIDFKVATVPINFEQTNYKRFDVGGVVSAGVELPVGNAKLFADARYTRGFNTVYEVPVVGAGVQNTAFGGSLGFMVPFGGNSKKNAIASR
jgi:Outer membrane protein beta-barrel domain